MDRSDIDGIKKVAKKAFEIYKEVDDLKEEGENKLLDAFEKSPLNHYIDSEPQVNPVWRFFLFNFKKSIIIFNFELFRMEAIKMM